MKLFRFMTLLAGCGVLAASLQAASVHTSSLPVGVMLDKSQKQHLYLEGEDGKKSAEQDKFIDPADAERTSFRTDVKPKDAYAGTAQAYDGTRHFLYGSDKSSRDAYSIYWEDASAKLEPGRYAAYVRALPSPNGGTQTYTLRLGVDRAAVDAADAPPIGSTTTEAKAEIKWYKIGQFQTNAQLDTFRLDISTKSSSIRFDTVLIVPLTPHRGALVLPPDAADRAQLPGHNFAADRGRLKLEVMAMEDVQSLRVQLRDETGKIISESEPPIAKGEDSSGIAIVELPGRGYFLVNAQVNYRDGKVATCQTTAAVLGVPLDESLRSKSRLGIWNVHGDTALIEAAGARWNRRMTSLRTITQAQVAAAATQPSAPPAAKTSLNEIGVYAFGLPPWAMDLPADFKQKGFGAPFQKPRDWDDVSKIVQTHTKQSTPNGFPAYFELYNEPEWHWKGADEDLVRFFATAAKAMKATQPNTQVLGPGMSGIRLSEFKERWVRHGLLDHLDGILLHAYVSGTAPEGEFIRNVRDLKRYLNSIGRSDLPLYFTEFGWTSAAGTWAVPVDELAQARYCARSLALLNHEDVAAAVYFCLLYRNERNPGETGFSVLNTDHTPKPAYVAFANACRWLAGTTPGKLLQLTPSTYVLVCRQDARTIAVAWDTEGAQQLILPTHPVRAEDMMGRSVKPGPQGDLPIGPSPTFIELSDPMLEQLAMVEPRHVRKGGRVELPWTALSCPAPLVARERTLEVPEDMRTGRYLVMGKVADGLAALPIDVTPAVRIESAELDWPAASVSPRLALRARSFMESEAPLALSATFNGVPGNLEDRVTIGANASRDVQIALPQFKAGQRYKGQILAQLEGMGANGRDSRRLDLTFLSAASAPSKAIDWQSIPEVDITSWGPFVANKPADVAVEDCSARIQTACSPRGLHVRVQVTDDEQKQEKTPMMMWQGDSLQFGFDFDADKPWVANAGGYNGHVRVYEMGVGLVDGKATVWRWISYDPDRPSNMTVEDVAATIARQGTLTTYELTIPWASVGLTQAPAVGSRIGFSLVVNDSDSSKPLHGLRLSNGINIAEEGGAKSKDPGAYGTLWVR